MNTQFLSRSKYLHGFILGISMSMLGSAYSWAGDVTVLVTDMNGNPVENAVVYAESSTKSSNSNPGTAAIEQKGRKFAPLVTVVQAGASITFPNRDTVKHHVYSFSPAKTFELKLYSGVPAAPVVFDKAGTVVLGCNIHDQMIAYVQVVDTPYFDKTNSTGKVKLTDIPNGNYDLKTWHYGLVKENAVVEQAITVKGSEQLAVKIDIKP